jgi:hypothetical protein
MLVIEYSLEIFQKLFGAAPKTTLASCRRALRKKRSSSFVNKSLTIDLTKIVDDLQDAERVKVCILRNGACFTQDWGVP